MPPELPIALSLADEQDREAIYAIRHQVYARELGQHRESPAGRLTDPLDEVNVYLVARRGDAIAGFVSVTPPNPVGYSLDKYFRRDSLPFAVDEGLYEVRLLTITKAHRRTPLAGLLMYAALRWVESQGARSIAAIGRVEVLDLYTRAGLKSLGLRVQAGEVTYELMAADVRDLRGHLVRFAGFLRRLERTVDWRIEGVPFRDDDGCYHGGAFWEAIGDEFDALQRGGDVINADVLDAWFDPAPAVIEQVQRHLPFALRTSPPTLCEGMHRAIARARGLEEANVLPGAGSSDLIFAALRHWVRPASRVLILDPMYGEYAHVLERVIGARVDRLPLKRRQAYDVDCHLLASLTARGYDWILLVNPNSPTGRHVPRGEAEKLLSGAPAATRWWIDETYVDFAGEDQTLEAFASSSSNVVVCKSMSKVYALSGARAAYLCGPARMMAEIARLCPPWSVSLPGQIAACAALGAGDYYRARWQETRELRAELQTGLERLGWDVVAGCANFLLCHLPARAPAAAALAARTRRRGLFLREVTGMGKQVDARTLRIAVKDRRTNARMLAILEETLAELGAPP